jgi:hypothetical protein
MRKDLLILALGLFAAAGTAAADDLALPEGQDAGAMTAADAPPDMPAAPAALPAKGTAMGAVRKKFGEPREKHGPVGGDSPKHPPITRWDYDGFLVIFENDRVVDAVVPGAPPKLYSTAGLSPATNAPPPPEPPMETPAAPAPEAEPMIPEAPAEQAPPMEPAAEATPPAEAPPAEMAPAEPAPPAQPTPTLTPEEVPEDQPPTPK